MIERQGVDPTKKLLELDAVARNIARGIGRSIGHDLPKGIGFALLVFEFGTNGLLTWISNAQRADMVKSLRECADKLEKK